MIRNIIALFATFCLISCHEKVRCVNLSPYEPILNGIIDAIPGRAIQDAIPLPIKVNDGGEVFRLTIDALLCNINIVFDNLVLQVINTNFEKMKFEVIDKESVYLTLPFGIQGTLRVSASCLLYRPKIFNQIEFAATLTPRADVCVDILGLGNLGDILNYTYATVSDIAYKPDAQNMYWCIYDALPLLESIIDNAIEKNVDKIWAAIDKALNDALLPGMEKAINSALRAIGIKPYDESIVEDIYPLGRMIKPAPEKINKLSVILTSNFTKTIYNDKGTGAWMDVSFYRPTSTSPGYYPLGDYGQRNYNAPTGTVQMVLDDGTGAIVRKPVDYQLVWESRVLFSDDGSIWRPVPPAGYVALGHVAQSGYKKPSLDIMRVIRSDCAVRCDPWLLWTDRCSKVRDDVGTWSIAQTTTSPIPGTFISSPNYEKPSDEFLYCLNPDCIA